MVARLFHAPTHPQETSVGTGTIGSSEAIMLAGLACKRKWQLARQAAGLPIDRPNIILGANLQVVWEKFARYFEVELRAVSLEPGQLVLDPKRAAEMADECTICVVAILGSTFNGEFEDVAELDRLLEEKKKATGVDVPIHVDAASGGFVAPFLWPDLVWDFRLKSVCSINVSGHKYGLVYPGIGWVVWRSKEQLPEDLIFHINYLGADQPTFTLNFSKSACQIIAQYYQFIRLGFQGYRRVMENCRTEAAFLTKGLVDSGRFEMLSKDVGVPVVAASLKSRDDFDEDDVCEHLRRFGWTVPSYTLPPNLQDHKMLRVVVREDFSRSLAERLLVDFKKTLDYLDAHKPKRKEALPAQDLQPTTPQVRRAPKRKAAEKVEELPHVLDHAALKDRMFRHSKKFSINKTNPPC